MMNFTMEGFLVYFLIFARVLSFIIASPLFSIKGIPVLLKIALSMILSHLLFLVIGQGISIYANSLLAYGLLMMYEILFGLALGYAVNLLFICIQMAGQMIDFQIGFSMAATYDPLTNTKVSLFGNMYYWVGVALFFAINGHYYLIYSLAQSFDLVPLNSLTLIGLNLTKIIELFSGGFLIAFQIAVPTIIILLLMDAIMGLLARTVPQLNILMLGLPLKVLVGLLATIVLLPALGTMMVRVIESIPYRIDQLLQFLPFIFLFAADEKTEQPTPKKLEDARKKGQVAKSTDLNSAIILLLLVLLISIFGHYIFSNIFLFLQNTLANGLNRSISQGRVSQLILEQMAAYFKITFPILGGVMVVGVIANLVQIGFVRSFHPLKPDIKRLNPIEGFKRIVSKKSIFELSKNLLKLIVVAYIAYSYIRDHIHDIFSTTQMSIQGYFPFFKEVILGMMLRIGVVMIILATIDFIYQRYDFKKNLKMTKHEVKEELKQMEGDPQIKSMRKQKQRQLAMQRMMAEVPDATVIVTNPTHLAIAIQYDENTIGAPMVLAKGADYVAEKIRAIAKEEDIPIIENKPLARVLYQQVDIGQEVPMELYQTVAEILAVVYQMQNKSKFV